MELLVRSCLALLGTFLSVCLLHYECKKLDGYQFPVYSTEICPRNKSEWKERSSAINCTEDNGYLCFPNEKFTQLLEFCHNKRFILIEKGSCLYLQKDDSAIYAYNCSSFQSGCHNTSFSSHNLFQHSSCTSIGKGCFLAEPSCKGSDTTTSLPETTKPTHVENVTRKYSSTASTDEKTNQTLTYNDYVIYDEIFMMPILAGVLIPIILFSMLCVIYKKGYHICKTKKDTESSKEEELESLLSVNDQNNKESPLDQDVFEQWQEDNKTFVSTRACKEVEKLIKRQNLVVVTGNSGSGKSAIIQHIALSYRNEGWTVKTLYNVEEIHDTYSSVGLLQNRILYVFHDPLGKESFVEIAYNSWKEYEDRFKARLKKIKILLSCRKCILNDDRVGGIFKKKSYIIDLSDNKNKLNKEETLKIWNMYSSNSDFSNEDINEIITTEKYFPLLCKLYFSDNNEQTIGLRFFKEPFGVFLEQIRHFRNECKEKYCALVLLVLFNNQFCICDIRRSDHSIQKFKLALELCGMSNTAPHKINEALKALRGFFVKKIGDTYHFYHDFLMEVTTYVFGTDYPLETIRYADIGFLRRRVNLKSSNDNRNKMKLENVDLEIDKFTICLNDKYVSDLGDRLFNEMFGDRMLDVVLNPCMRNKKVVAFIIQKLKDSPDKLSKLLTKKRLRQQFRNQEDYQTLKQSIGSKLEFLYFEDEVPILSAIIVFCHTNVSKHCLETLQNSLEGTALFSAVCCNGSMDLFNVFPKKQIKKFMIETWGQYYPIHIVSLFHNPEILRELIRVENEVNLSAGEEYGYTPLMLAAFNSDRNKQKNKEGRIQSIDTTVELLLNHGAQINLCIPVFESPLHIASAEGNDYIVELLLDKRADICLCDTNNETPLHKASEEGHDSTVQLLLDKGAGINSFDINKETPLHKASEEGHDSTVQLLLEKGADIISDDTNKETPLHKASEEGHDSTVQLLLDKGADINSCDTNRETPLHKASKWGCESTVQLLINKGADINSCDTNNETPLHKAIKWGRKSTVQLLLEKGAKINQCDTNKESLLCNASKWGLDSTVQLLLDNGADITSYNTNKETSLHKASEWGHESTVRLLLYKGARINSLDTNKETPLHKACKSGHDSTAQLLFNEGAGVNLCDRNEETPLHKASKWGHASTTQLLLEKGAYINSCDTNKETPLHKASEWGHESTVQLLLNKGSDINACDTNKETPLHKASKWGHVRIVQLLLDKGADINSYDKNKETPLYKASVHGRESTVNLLTNRGADIN